VRELQSNSKFQNPRPRQSSGCGSIHGELSVIRLKTVGPETVPGVRIPAPPLSIEYHKEIRPRCSPAKPLGLPTELLKARVRSGF
jgi:hypothetical protein